MFFEKINLRPADYIIFMALIVTPSTMWTLGELSINRLEKENKEIRAQMTSMQDLIITNFNRRLEEINRLRRAMRDEYRQDFRDLRALLTCREYYESIEDG